MSIYDFTVKDAQENDLSLADYKDQVLLIVNVASKCGFTPQYDGLQALYEEYKDQGFTILGFPCNQFKGQEPGSNEEIQNFCRLDYGVEFPVLAKIDVNGENEAELYTYLKKERPQADDADDPKLAESINMLKGISPAEKEEDILWNFEKFLIDRQGQVVGRYSSGHEPAELAGEIEKYL